MKLIKNYYKFGLSFIITSTALFILLALPTIDKQLFLKPAIIFSLGTLFFIGLFIFIFTYFTDLLKKAKHKYFKFMVITLELLVLFVFTYLYILIISLSPTSSFKKIINDETYLGLYHFDKIYLYQEVNIFYLKANPDFIYDQTQDSYKKID